HRGLGRDLAERLRLPRATGFRVAAVEAELRQFVPGGVPEVVPTVQGGAVGERVHLGRGRRCRADRRGENIALGCGEDRVVVERHVAVLPTCCEEAARRAGSAPEHATSPRTASRTGSAPWFR